MNTCNDSNWGWRYTSIAFTLILCLPIVVIFTTALGQSEPIFEHLIQTVMSVYLLNTLGIAVGVTIVALCLGVSTGWFMAMCQIPSARYLQWALVLPLAMPAYVIGYLFTDWLDYAGPIQVLLREWMGWESQTYWFPDIRTLPGASLVLGLVLYPYLYLMCRAAFLEQGDALLQSARLLKCSPWRVFFRVSLPIIRPSLAVGVSLVVMEAVGDFGAVSLFSVNTLTTAIYDTWLGHANIHAAAKIASMMLLIIMLCVSAERYSRRKQRLFQLHGSSIPVTRYVLQGWKKWFAFGWCWSIVLIAFLLPMVQLMVYAWDYFSESWTPEFRTYAMNSFKVSIIAACCAVLIATVMNIHARLSFSMVSRFLMRCSSLGYAVPGTVLAIGVMVFLLFFDHVINDIAQRFGWHRPGLLLSGSVFAVIVAMLVRFTAIALGSIESSLSKVSPSLDMASRTMGYPPSTMVRYVHIPLVRRGVLIAGLLVFIESMKELNAALLLRPFNFETLATYVYTYVSTEQLEVAALPALLLVVVGFIPLVIINRSLESVAK